MCQNFSIFPFLKTFCFLWSYFFFFWHSFPRMSHVYDSKPPLCFLGYLEDEITVSVNIL